MTVSCMCAGKILPVPGLSKKGNNWQDYSSPEYTMNSLPWNQPHIVTLLVLAMPLQMKILGKSNHAESHEWIIRISLKHSTAKGMNDSWKACNHSHRNINIINNNHTITYYFFDGSGSGVFRDFWHLLVSADPFWGSTCTLTCFFTVTSLLEFLGLVSAAWVLASMDKHDHSV